MTYTFRLIRIALAILMSGCMTISSGRAEKPMVRIGIAVDGPWERNERIRTTFKREITQLLRAQYDVQFPLDKSLQADWSAAGVKENIDRLLADSEVDYVLTLGVLSSNDVARRVPCPRQ